MTICEPELDDPGGSRLRFVKDRSETQWNDWRWQLQNSISSIEDVQEILSEKGITISDKTIEAAKQFPLSITPYYFSLIQEFSYDDPVFSQCIPSEKELDNPSFLSDDPLAEEHDTVVDNLVHRYNDRALLISTSQCAMYCRHCTRKRVAGSKDFCLSNNQLENIVKYLKNHPEIKDVIVSGGDPLTMSTPKIEKILYNLRSVDSIDIIRIGTRTPVTLPMRITDELVNMLSEYHPLWINTHFNHPNEITPESQEACAKLVNKGIPLGNQCVLLKNVNDDANTMIDLCRKLVKMRVRPYYMYQCDLVKGVEHFRTPVSKGIEIMEQLRGRVSGLGIPNFIIDSPQGKGKIPILPNYILDRDNKQTILRNYNNEIVSYPDP
jgi:lysine 2,3-aminomutase